MEKTSDLYFIICTSIYNFRIIIFTTMNLVNEHRTRQFKIPHDKAETILRDAMKEATLIRVDELRSGNMRRTPTQKGIEWVLNFILKSKAPHIVCIERGAIYTDTYPYFDFGASTMLNEPDYFLWIEVPIPNSEQIIEKYQLKQLQ